MLLVGMKMSFFTKKSETACSVVYLEVNISETQISYDHLNVYQGHPVSRTTVVG